jgi:hypothetical protein
MESAFGKEISKNMNDNNENNLSAREFLMHGNY